MLFNVEIIGTKMERYLTENEQTKLLETMQKYSDDLAQRDYYITLALINSGMRINEFLNIKIKDVMAAFDTKYLYIPKENRKGKKKDHMIYLTQSLRKAFINLLSINESNEDPENYLITGRNENEPMCARNIQKRIKKWAVEAGLSHLNVTPHYFRHTYAMNIIRKSTAKEPIRIVKAALGHINLNTTAIYTEPNRESVSQALDEIDQFTPKRITISTLRNYRNNYK